MTAFDNKSNPWGVKGDNVFEFWMSFWPVAPYFGVEWRFAPFFAPFSGLAEAAERSIDSTLSSAGDQFDKAMSSGKASIKAASDAAKVETTKVLEGVAELAQAPAAAAKKASPAPKAKNGPTLVAETPKPKPAPAPVAEAKPAPKAEAPKAVEKPAPVEKVAEKPVAKPADGKPASLMAKAPAKSDDLKLIKGIGPKLEKELNGLGVYTFDQMAGFSKDDLSWIDDNLTAFKGRCFRDDWTGQAKALLG